MGAKRAKFPRYSTFGILCFKDEKGVESSWLFPWKTQTKRKYKKETIAELKQMFLKWKRKWKWNDFFGGQPQEWIIFVSNKYVFLFGYSVSIKTMCGLGQHALSKLYGRCSTQLVLLPLSQNKRMYLYIEMHLRYIQMSYLF
jgi:hypothetical protein